MASWKDPVRALISSNVSLTTCPVAQDGITLLAGDRVLLTRQTTAADNGIYVVGTVAGGNAPLTRALDANSPALLGPETAARVSEGSVYAHSEWALITSGSITLGTTPLTFAKILGGAAIPTPALVATSNIALTGVVTVDGVASNTIAGDVLCTAQTTASENGYWTPNSGGAWTRPAYYNSDAAVAAALGLLSGAALGGTLNKGKRFYALSGATLASAKIWYPAVAGAEINVSGAPWYWPGDGSSQETQKSALLAYCATLSAAQMGGTLVFGPGTYAYTSKLMLPANWGIRGMGAGGTTLDALVNGDPYDSVGMPAVLNVGGAGYTKISGVKIRNRFGSGALQVWSAGNNTYSVGQFVYPTRCSNIILKCKAAGTTGAFEPIGELSNGAFIKSIGTAAAAAQTLLVPVAAGSLGAFSFKLSVDAGVTQSATQTTTAGDYQTFIVDTVLGGSTYGTTYGFRISNQNYAATVHTTTLAFTQPAVYTTSVPAFVNVQLDSSSGFGAGQYLLGSTGGLWMVANVPDATHVNLWNLGANGAATAGTIIPSGTTLRLCHAPAPRIEVIGPPPAAGWTVDVQMVGGPLGSAACQYQYGQTGAAEKWKFGLTVPSGSWTNTTGGAGTWTSPNLNVPGATSLQLRFHTGLAYNNGTWGYMTPSQTWSEQAGTDVVDGTVTWTICKGTACLDLTGYFTTIEDMFFEGGTFNVRLNQCEADVLQGSITYAQARSASIHGVEGSITNCNALNGCHAFFDGFWSIISDGGLGFSTNGMLGFQGGSTGCMYLAGMYGVNISGAYLEAYGNVCRNSSFFGRAGLGFSVVNMEVGGGYMGSCVGASTFDFYNCSGISIHGLSVGGSVAVFTGVGSCSNFNVEGVTHITNGAIPTFDAWPLSGHGFISDNGGTFYQIGACIKSSTPNRTFAGTTDTALTTDNCGNVTSTGAAAAVVTVGTRPAGTVITYEQGGAGALSFTASGVTLQTALGAGGATTGQYQTRTLFWKDATHVRIT